MALWSAPAGAADVHQLAPAEPQPDAKSLKPGLAVEYVYREAKSLHDAESYRGYNLESRGEPLKGFVYGDTNPGDGALTSGASELVIAYIKGYMRFEAGQHELEFQSNDGLRVILGGVQVYEHDLRHPCVSNGAVTVKAPQAGWYPVEALYFQRLGTSCLDLSIRRPGGEWDWTEPEIYAHLPG
ncbi:MAG: hypothetical protein QF578_18425 [Alphaproteobacteria bacterium]|jgi:hypothetical protein|nr:hypothetical protein [Alphaproteobacteria bacterium]MDP6813920.1 hypothetical protein [Alphaproteobacteria bacterium]|tara:strand:- start:113 stop:664 length:552 start_codon:yes stop_codon:yes gene_type:complete